jgi:hypothetical protein
MPVVNYYREANKVVEVSVDVLGVSKEYGSQFHRAFH